MLQLKDYLAFRLLSRVPCARGLSPRGKSGLSNLRKEFSLKIQKKMIRYVWNYSIQGKRNVMITYWGITALVIL